MNNIVWKVWKFRMRMALGARDVPKGPLASPDELDALVRLQTAYWESNPPLPPHAAREVLQALNARSISAFIFSVRGRHVRLWEKPALSFPPEEAAMRREQHRNFLGRALLYQAFIAAVLRSRKARHSFDFALDVNDLPEDSSDVPIFGFQKERGAHNLLLPDVDFFYSKWYRKEHDALAYEDKEVSACFVGSSTGAWLTADDVRRHESPRLRAAAYFHGHPRVMFRIANATQCLSEEARACLMGQPYFSAYVGWEDQLRHRFLIVMDGNGATCSRLVKGLLSNSVVVKFDSPHELYYFPALQAGRDWLLVEQEKDVEQIIECETAQPGSFKGVAASGQQFAAKYLTQRSVMDYTAQLFKAFAALGQG